MDYEVFRKTFAVRIAALRMNKNISSRQLSKELGQCVSYINKIENGLAMPSMEMMFKICEYFNITPSDFFAEGANNPTEYKELSQVYGSLNKDNAELLLTIANKLKASERSPHKK